MKVSKWKDCMKHIKTLFFGHFVINCRKIFALVASFFLPDCYFALPTNVFERRNLIQHWITHSLPTDHVCTPHFWAQHRSLSHPILLQLDQYWVDRMQSSVISSFSPHSISLGAFLVYVLQLLVDICRECECIMKMAWWWCWLHFSRALI